MEELIKKKKEIIVLNLKKYGRSSLPFFEKEFILLDEGFDCFYKLDLENQEILFKILSEKNAIFDVCRTLSISTYDGVEFKGIEDYGKFTIALEELNILIDCMILIDNVLTKDEYCYITNIYTVKEKLKIKLRNDKIL